jgi:hypothetical protein
LSGRTPLPWALIRTVASGTAAAAWTRSGAPPPEQPAAPQSAIATATALVLTHTLRTVGDISHR